MRLQHSSRRTESVLNSICAGLLVAVGACGATTLVAGQVLAQSSPEVGEVIRHVDLRASLLHAGSTSADVERALGKPTVATDLGEPRSGNTALVFENEPVRTHVTLTAGKVTAITLDVAYVDPAPLPARARVIKATMVRGGVTGLIGVPSFSQNWVEAGRHIEQMVFVQPGEPGFSVFLVDGLVVDVTLGREKPPNLTSMLLPVTISDASVSAQLALGLNQTQVAALLGPTESLIHFTFKGQPVEYADYHQRDGNGLITTTSIGGVLTAFTLWPSDEL